VAPGDCGAATRRCRGWRSGCIINERQFQQAQTGRRYHRGVVKKRPRNTEAEERATPSMLRKRAQQRWSSLVSQRRSRLGQMMGMRAFLGDDEWLKFVAFATKHWKPQWMAHFTMAHTSCVGSPAGEPCPSSFGVDTDSPRSHIARLHLDHTISAERICRVWKLALARHRRPYNSWHHGISRDALCLLLFGTSSMKRRRQGLSRKPNLMFRCGPVPRRARDDREVMSPYCHHMFANSAAGLHVSDISL
jgi:hypothetical protein